MNRTSDNNYANWLRKSFHHESFEKRLSRLRNNRLGMIQCGVVQSIGAVIMLIFFPISAAGIILLSGSVFSGSLALYWDNRIKTLLTFDALSELKDANQSSKPLSIEDT